jgi:integrase/recombinase XerD
MLHQLKNSEFCLKPAQIRRIIDKAGTFRNRCIIKAFAQTGIRRAELVALDIQDIDLVQRLMHIRNGMGGTARFIPLTSELAEDLKRLMGGLKSGPVLQSRNGGKLTVRQINWIVAQAGKRAKVKNPNPKYRNVNCHLFRHSFAREWKKRRGSIESLSKILGHASVKTTLDVYGTEGLGDVQRNYESVMAKIWQ